MSRIRLWFVLFSFCFSLALPVAAAFSAQPTELPELTGIFGRDSQKSDFVFVVDTSGSMKPFWGAVRDSISAFVEQLPEGDHFSLLYFDNEAGELITRLAVTGANRQNIRRQIAELKDPRGQKTDLGRGCKQLLDEINLPLGSPLKFVFVFTDFKHEPLDGSPWTRSADDPAWKQLAERKLQVVDRQGTILKVYALQLPLGPGVGRDVALFDGVFGQTQKVTVGNSANLEEWFQTQKLLINREKIKVQAEADLARGVVEETGPTADDGRISLSLRSQLKKLSLDVTTVRMTGKLDGLDLAGLPLDFKPGVLGPGEKLSVTVVLPELRPGLFSAKRLRHTDRLELAANLIMVATPRPAGELAIIGSGGERTFASLLQATISRTSGLPVWIPVALLFLCAIAGFAFYYVWFRPERFSATVLIANERANERHEVYHKVTVHLGNTGDCRSGGVFSSLFEGTVEIEFRGRTPGFLRFKPQRGMYVRVKQGRGRYQTTRVNEASNELERVWLPLPDEFLSSDEPVYFPLILEAGGCRVTCQ